jgi:hypothetical protein
MSRRLLVVLFVLCVLACLLFVTNAHAGDIPTDRPGDKDKPVEVNFFVFVLDVDDISGANQNFSINVFMRMIWKDERLADKDIPVRSLPLSKIWHPHVIIANKQFFVRKSLPDVVRVESDGTITYAQRYLGPLSQRLNLSRFPFDKHTFGINFISTRYTPDQVKFIPSLSPQDPTIIGGGISQELSLADWEITDHLVETRPYNPMEDVLTAGFIFEFTADRYELYYIWQVIIPLFLIVLMSWGALWIDPTSSGTQIGLATSSILTLIAYRFMLGNLIPRLPYMTRMDYFTLGSTVLVFFMLIEVVTTSFLARHGMEKTARRMDRWGRVTFPIVFVAWSAWSFLEL